MIFKYDEGDLVMVDDRAFTRRCRGKMATVDQKLYQAKGPAYYVIMCDTQERVAFWEKTLSPVDCGSGPLISADSLMEVL